MVMDQTSAEKNKIVVSSTFIENIFWSGLTLVSSNVIITIEIYFLKMLKTKQQKEKRTQIMRWKTDNLQIFTL